MIASDGGKYKIDLADGEVAIYDAAGNVIHLQNSGKILIESKTEVKVTSQKAIINSGDIFLGPEALAALAGGVVTTMCSCAISGALHPVGSSQVKAAL
jgi:phage gp45-like